MPKMLLDSLAKSCYSHPIVIFTQPTTPRIPYAQDPYDAIFPTLPKNLQLLVCRVQLLEEKIHFAQRDLSRLQKELQEALHA